MGINKLFSSRGQQTKGLNYDTILEFFDEIDPKVGELVLMNPKTIFFRHRNIVKQVKIIGNSCLKRKIQKNHFGND